MPRRIAVVVGGADCVWSDLEQTRALATGHELEYFVVNDQMASWPTPAVGVTLHPTKLTQWLAARGGAKLPGLIEIWSNIIRPPHVTNVIKDWGGSSGLFAYQAARSNGHEQVIFCGVPMTYEHLHFVRLQPWRAVTCFQKYWELHLDEIRAHARSWSGWTAEKLGMPDEVWLRDAAVQ